ncbi:TMEM165/GDT1 family protein [Geoglobus acetivorans]
MLEDLVIPFTVVGLAELGDKTQLSVLLLSSRTENRLRLILGVLLAFMVVDGAAIVVGDLAGNAIPENLMRGISAVLFVAFGVLILLKGNEDETEAKSLSNPFYSGFALVFFAEWGDKTQIASGILATRYDPLLVFTGVMLSLGLLTVVAVYAGKAISERVERRIISAISGVIFIALGIGFAFL